jgi:predicted transcriptional regulator
MKKDEEVVVLLRKFESRIKQRLFGEDWYTLARIYNSFREGFENRLLFPVRVEKVFPGKYPDKATLYRGIKKNIDCLDSVIRYHGRLFKKYEEVLQGTPTEKAKETPTWYLNLTDTIWSIFVSGYKKRKQKKGKGKTIDLAVLTRNLEFVKQEILHSSPKLYVMVEKNGQKPDLFTRCIPATLCLYAASAFNLRYPEHSLAVQKRKEKRKTDEQALVDLIKEKGFTPADIIRICIKGPVK